jgi:uncharacterized protein (TIGR02147 family)
MRRTGGIDVFAYLDFRAFLRDVYASKKGEGRGFSFRAFSRRAGLRSPNHLKRVIDGERNLTADMAVRYAEALGLTGEAAAYFSDLVAFNQAKSGPERNAAYQRLTGSRGYRKAHKLDVAKAAYHDTWYLPAIREMAARSDFVADPAWIAARLRPPIAPADASRALDTLFEIGLLVRDGSGKVTQGESLVTTGPETRGLHIRAYHRAMMERAAEALDGVAAAERDISSLTFCVGEDGLKRLKERLQKFRQEIIALASQETSPDQVVQLNLQLFPLSTSRKEET